MQAKDWHAATVDWRAALKRNERKTAVVIVLFVLIYVAVGVLADILLLHTIYPNASLATCADAILTLRVTPYASLTMLLIASLSLIIGYAWYDRIMLLGTEAWLVTPQTAKTLAEKQLYHVVEEMRVAAGMRFMPKVYLIEAGYMNAFASGYSEKSAMLAITRGLLDKLQRDELQAVMAHELSHIRHHDIKLTLAVAILSNIMLIMVDMLFYAVIFRRDDRRGDNPIVLAIIVLRYLLPLLTVVLTLFLSRTREFMADSGSVELMRVNEPMARALLKIDADHTSHAAQYTQEYGHTAHEQVRHASYLYDPSAIDPVKSLYNLFSTHPSIAQRLQAIGFKRK